MRLWTVAVVLPVLAGCGGVGGGSTTDQQTYQIAGRIDALVIDARAAAVVLETGDGPVTVAETYRFAGDKPATAHRVEGGTLRLTETGCRDDGILCEVEFRVQLPAATRADITSQAGAVQVTGTTGDLAVTTQAGAIEGRALGGDQVSFSTQAGAVTMEFARAPSMARASTEVGAVEVRVPSGPSYAVDVQSTVSHSDISVQRDPASTHKIQVRAGVGAVKIGNT
jgi:hypothetical protein